MSKTKLITVSKKQLRQILSSDDRYALSPYHFRKLFFTDAFIQDNLEMTIQAFQDCKTFNPQQTRIIIDFFKINETDLN